MGLISHLYVTLLNLIPHHRLRYILLSSSILFQKRVSVIDNPINITSLNVQRMNYPLTGACVCTNQQRSSEGILPKLGTVLKI